MHDEVHVVIVVCEDKTCGIQVCWLNINGLANEDPQIFGLTIRHDMTCCCRLFIVARIVLCVCFFLFGPSPCFVV